MQPRTWKKIPQGNALDWDRPWIYRKTVDTGYRPTLNDGL